MSRCVTGVPLPGWMFSAFMTTHSLPSRSSTLPLRTELAITLTTVDLSASVRAVQEPSARRSGGRLAKSVGRFLQAFSGIAKEQLSPCQKPATDQSPWWHAGHPRRPPAVPAGARAHQGGAARLVRGPGLHRGRDRRAAGVARQRDAPARLRHRADRPGWHPSAALSPHLARVRLQETAGCRRGADLHVRAGASATASAARCTIRPSPCSNGIAPTSPTSG